MHLNNIYIPIVFYKSITHIYLHKRRYCRSGKGIVGSNPGRPDIWYLLNHSKREQQYKIGMNLLFKQIVLL